MNEQVFQTPLKRRSHAAEFRKTARDALKGRWGLAIGLMLLSAILGGASSLPSVSINLDTEEFKVFFGEHASSDMSLLELISAVIKSSMGEFLLILIGGSAVVSLFFTLFVGGPVSVGYSRFQLDLIDGKKETGVGALFAPFSTCYWRSVGVRTLLLLITTALSVGMLAMSALVAFAFLTPIMNSVNVGQLEGFVKEPSAAAAVELMAATFGMVLVILLVSAVFLVLEIVITYRYALAPYILAEYPDMSASDVLRNSRILMKGNKWRLFCLQFSFIGWWILSFCCTCGIGILWVIPYTNAAMGAFYDEVAGRAQAREVEFPSLNPEDYFPQE